MADESKRGKETPFQKIITYIWIVGLVVGCIIMTFFVPDEMIVIAGTIFLCIEGILTVILYSSFYGFDWLTKEF